MYTEYTVLQRLHFDVEDQLVLSAFKYHHFRKAWYTFMNLIDIDYDKGFSCNICGTSPELVVMDATSVSFRAALDSWKSFVGSMQQSEIIKSSR